MTNRVTLGRFQDPFESKPSNEVDNSKSSIAGAKQDIIIASKDSRINGRSVVKFIRIDHHEEEMAKSKNLDTAYKISDFYLLTATTQSNGVKTYAASPETIKALSAENVDIYINDVKITEPLAGRIRELTSEEEEELDRYVSLYFITIVPRASSEPSIAEKDWEKKRREEDLHADHEVVFRHAPTMSPDVAKVGRDALRSTEGLIGVVSQVAKALVSFREDLLADERKEEAEEAEEKDEVAAKKRASASEDNIEKGMEFRRGLQEAQGDGVIVDNRQSTKSPKGGVDTTKW